MQPPARVHQVLGTTDRRGRDPEPVGVWVKLHVNTWILNIRGVDETLRWLSPPFWYLQYLQCVDYEFGSQVVRRP